MWPKKTSNFINEDKNLNLKTQVVLVQYLEAQIIGQPSSKAQSTWGRTENGPSRKAHYSNCHRACTEYHKYLPYRVALVCFRREEEHILLKNTNNNKRRRKRRKETNKDGRWRRGRRDKAEQEIFGQRRRGGWLQDQVRYGLEPLLPQPEAMAPSLLPQPTPQVDRRADPGPAPASHRGGLPRGMSPPPPFPWHPFISIFMLSLHHNFFWSVGNFSSLSFLSFVQYAQEQEFFRQAALVSKKDKEKVLKLLLLLLLFSLENIWLFSLFIPFTTYYSNSERTRSHCLS